MSLYIIGIGGTGAKCLEAIANLAAVGLLNESERTEQTIHSLFIDADETNGSLARSLNTLSLYQKCYSLFAQNRQSSPWIQTQVRSLGLWSPFSRTSTDKKLGALFSYSTLKQNSPELGSLFDVLFTRDEREATLDVGFRGRPAIGSAVMSQVDLDRLDEDVWRTLIERIQVDIGSGWLPRIVLFGSMFGGTGASGLPTIGRLLSNKLRVAQVRNRVPIACVFLLPYFSFTPSGTLAEGEVFARADQFLLNTEAALRYYLTQAQQATEQAFDSVYLLGNQSLSQVEFSIGKQTQRNKPHFVELYAALAARHFLLNSNAETAAEAASVVLVSRQTQGTLAWRDLPDPQVTQPALSNGVRFAYVWLSNIAPELARAKAVGVDRFQRDSPWFNKFFQPKTSAIERMAGLGGEALANFNDAKEQDAIAAVSEWCKDFLRWLTEMHQCDEEAISLFRTDRLTTLTGQQVSSEDELSKLVVGVEFDRNKQAIDTIPNLKLNLDRDWTPSGFGKGTVGLVRALYFLCKS
jgi:Tubulin like